MAKIIGTVSDFPPESRYEWVTVTVMGTVAHTITCNRTEGMRETRFERDKRQEEAQRYVHFWRNLPKQQIS